MNTTRLPRFLLSAALLAAALPAFAQNRAGTVEITPFGGGRFGGTLEEGSNAVFDRSVDTDASATFGLRVALNASRWFGVEAAYTQSRADVSRGSDTLFGNGQELGRLDMKSYEVNGLFNFGTGRAIPYFTIGAGATTFKLRTPVVTTSEDTRFSLNMGLGVKVFVNPHLGFRFEGRGRASYLDDQNCRSSSFCGSYRDSTDDGLWYSQGEATGGITIAF